MHAQKVTKVREPIMSDCRAIQNSLGRYFDGELSPVEQCMAEDHIKQCGECSEILQEIRTIAGALKGMPVLPVPSTLNRKILAKARAQFNSPPSAWNSLWFWKHWSLAMRLAAISVAAIACYIAVVISDSSLPAAQSAAAEMRWISMTAQGPIVKAYMGTKE
jgi:anti-sigma factor RsiW